MSPATASSRRRWVPPDFAMHQLASIMLTDLSWLLTYSHQMGNRKYVSIFYVLSRSLSKRSLLAYVQEAAVSAYSCQMTIVCLVHQSEQRQPQLLQDLARSAAAVGYQVHSC
jgi:hypothetical protein